VEILSGLEENDQVVIGNRSALRPGEKVQPKPAEEKKVSGKEGL
jgi:hypothetical protein